MTENNNINIDPVTGKQNSFSKTPPSGDSVQLSEQENSSKPGNFISTLIPIILGALAFIISLTIYYGTTCPVIYYGDAGELIVAGYNWGVAHPPGYPAYIIILGPLPPSLPTPSFFSRWRGRQTFYLHFSAR